MKALKMGFFAIPVTNMDAAKKFYGSVMGWDFNDRDADFSYVMANGESEKMSKTLAVVTASGGTVLEKLAMEGDERGYTAKISDPFKNTIGFWAPEN